MTRSHIYIALQAHRLIYVILIEFQLVANYCFLHSLEIILFYDYLLHCLYLSPVCEYQAIRRAQELHLIII